MHNGQCAGRHTTAHPNLPDTLRVKKMAIEQVSAKSTKTDKTATVDYDFGDNVQDMIDRFGEEVVFTNAKANMRVSLQGIIRSAMNAEPPRNPQEEADKWKPGTAAPRKSAVEKAKDLLGGLSEEQRAELLKNLGGKK